MPPESFISLLEESAGGEVCRRVVEALSREPVVSVRANPAKIGLEELRAHFGDLAGDAVPWASDCGFYLERRPSFTLDPLFHAGAYYVQEASSMYIGSLVPEGKGRTVLDLCAAPGGKSTHLLSRLDATDLLVANEVMSSRCGTLAANVARWGLPNVVVTNSDPSDFTPLEEIFDIVLADVPCSGEGMFRKDEEALRQWSPDNVRLCAARQRRIVSDVWPALKTSGILIYSTCTFNRIEDDDNVQWIASQLGATILGSRHFYPGIDRGEGFFCAVLRKEGNPRTPAALRNRGAAGPKSETEGSQFILPGYDIIARGDMLKAYPQHLAQRMRSLEGALKVIHSGVAVATRKGRDIVPEADLALSSALRRGAFPEADLSREEAVRYLSREPLLLKQSPRGYVLVTFEGQPLGFVKNLGNRTNNLYPQSQRIRNL